MSIGSSGFYNYASMPVAGVTEAEIAEAVAAQEAAALFVAEPPAPTTEELMQWMGVFGNVMRTDFTVRQTAQLVGPTSAASSFTPQLPSLPTLPTVPTAAPLAAPAVGAATAPANASTAPNSAGRKVVVAQIDNFNNGHGDMVANEINAGGDADILRFNTGGNGNQIAEKLREVVQLVGSGETIDVVNLSMQSVQDDPEVQGLIDQLTEMGVPVAIAAGNNGRGTRNGLATDNAFIVEATDGSGNVRDISGQGNIQYEGRTTSAATGGLAPLLGRLKAQGLSIAQIRAMF